MALLLKWYSLSSQRVETGYATGLYPFMASGLRFYLAGFRLVPVILFMAFWFWCVIKLAKNRLLIQKRPHGKELPAVLLKRQLCCFTLHSVQ